MWIRKAAALACLALPCLLAAGAAEKKRYHLPLIVSETSSMDKSPEVPLATLGSLPPERKEVMAQSPYDTTEGDQTQWYTFRYCNNADDLITQVTAGKVKLTAPRADAPTLVLLACPFVNIRESWIPSELTLEDHVVTVYVTVWDGDDGVVAEKNFSRRSEYLLSLGKLSAGDYTLAILCRHVGGKGEAVGKWNTAAAKFTVAEKPAEGAAAVTIAEKELKELNADIQPKGSVSLPPRHFARVADAQAKPPATLQVGTLKPLEKLMKTETGRLKKVPEVTAADDGTYAGSSLAAVVNFPELNSGEWIALRALEFDAEKKTLTIHADYWHDDGVRHDNWIHAGILVIPGIGYHVKPTLAVGDRFAGELTVRLQWRSFFAEEPGQPYVEKTIPADDKLLAPKSFQVKVERD